MVKADQGRVFLWPDTDRPNNSIENASIINAPITFNCGSKWAAFLKRTLSRKLNPLTRENHLQQISKAGLISRLQKLGHSAGSVHPRADVDFRVQFSDIYPKYLKIM